MKEQKSITIIWQDLGKPCPATTSQPSSQSVKVSSSKVTNEKKKKQLRAADISTTHNIQHKINKQTNKHYNYTTHHNMLIYKKCFTMRKIRAMYTVI